MNFSSFKKFQEELENKFDSSTKNQHYKLSYENISDIIDVSAPIWNILNLTEQEYYLKYSQQCSITDISHNKIIENHSIDISLNETVNHNNDNKKIFNE